MWLLESDEEEDGARSEDKKEEEDGGEDEARRRGGRGERARHAGASGRSPDAPATHEKPKVCRVLLCIGVIE